MFTILFNFYDVFDAFLLSLHDAPDKAPKTGLCQTTTNNDLWELQFAL
jgi:hypothetical protein